MLFLLKEAARDEVARRVGLATAGLGGFGGALAAGLLTRRYMMSRIPLFSRLFGRVPPQAIALPILFSILGGIGGGLGGYYGGRYLGGLIR